MSTIDDWLGDGLDALVRRHHGRRLRRNGHGAVLAPGPVAAGLWSPDGGPVRAGNTLDVLVDGRDALAAIGSAMGAARSHVHLSGWHLEPDFRLDRDAESPTVRELLADIAERVDVRVLLWAGPPLPAFQPTRKAMKSVRDQLQAGSRVACALDARERTLHCHHEKTIVIDDEIAFVGGIDLTDLAGDRWDENAHPVRDSTGWHDVSSRLTGPVVGDVAEHFRSRWTEVTGEHLPEPAWQPPTGSVEVQLLRTIPDHTYRFARSGEFSILDAYLRALSSAQDFIYLENQFLWSTEIVDVLVDKLQAPPTDDFRIVLVLPTRPSNGADTTRGQLGRLLQADNGNNRIVPATVHAHNGESDGPIYVHAKVGIVDDRWLTIGSANLNEHSLFNDTEVNVLTLDRELARQTRLRLWAEHLEHPVDQIDGPTGAVIDRYWKPLVDRPGGGAATAGPGLQRSPSGRATAGRFPSSRAAGGTHAWAARRRLSEPPCIGSRSKASIRAGGQPVVDLRKRNSGRRAGHGARGGGHLVIVVDQQDVVSRRPAAGIRMSAAVGHHRRGQNVSPGQAGTDDRRLPHSPGRLPLTVPDVSPSVRGTGGRQRSGREFYNGQQSAGVERMFDADPPGLGGRLVQKDVASGIHVEGRAEVAEPGK